MARSGFQKQKKKKTQSSMDAIESYKENVLPLKQGRSIATLVKTISSESTFAKQSHIEREQQYVLLSYIV